MIEETGTVLSLLPDDRVLVRVSRQRACGGCESNGACAQGLQGDAGRAEAISARTGGHALRAGDSVVLGVEAAVLWRGMGLLYGLPLLGLAVLGAAGQLLAGEAGAALGAVAGLAAGLLLAGLLSRKHRQDKYLPIVIKKAPP